MQKIMFNDRYGLTEAVLSGRKTMTRRIIKAPKRINGYDTYGFIVCQDIATHEVTGIYVRGYDGGTIDDIEILPKYEIGEVVAVAQSYKDAGYAPNDLTDIIRNGDTVFIPSKEHKGWANKMFTRWDYMLYRIRITDIRIERLQDISDEDCLREGIRYIPEIDRYYFERTDREEGFYFTSPRAAFAELIDRVSGRGTWDRNPYVVAYEFELLK
ncbi:MAG TPA: hypothetical protein H9927_08755 [Candidatus Alistipes merdipullorum]|nr:hypothetical protein [Candidatus Alistipes merdipullorum]